MIWTTLLAVLVIVLSGLVAGSLVFTHVALNPASRKLWAAAYVAYHQAINRTADPFMPRLVKATALTGLALVFATRAQADDGWSFALLIAGVAGTAAVAALTIAYNVPINRQVATWSIEAPPQDWEAIRDRWNRVHVVRTVVSVATCAAFAGGYLRALAFVSS
jgi:uncharacterized membrane protein